MSALGQLLGGGAAPDAGGGGDPEALLQQILQLMQQYLALGQDTPAFVPISEALPAIEEAMGGAAPTDSEGTADMASEPGGEPPAEVGTPPVGPDDPMSMQPSSPPTSFGDASAQALDAMKKKKGKGY